MASPKRTFGIIGVRSSLDRHDRIVEAKVSSDSGISRLFKMKNYYDL